jgi:putative spermidine/putrescine transport system ATP-binding protein
VQQVGTPEELHTRPVNRHVADFMGFRNLLRLRAVEVDGAAVVVEGAGLKLRGTAVAPVTAGEPVFAGVRPEHVSVGPRDAGTVPGIVDVVEYQGREIAVEIRTSDGLALHARMAVGALRPAPGDEVGVSVDPDALLVYPDDEAAGT